MTPREMIADLQRRVDEACSNALENDYDVDQWDAEDLARDVSDYDAQFEGIDWRYLVPFMHSWLYRQHLAETTIPWEVPS